LAQFSGWKDFLGTFQGEYDGRSARLVMSILNDAYSEEAILAISFTDLDRSEFYAGLHTVKKFNQSHIMANISLAQNIPNGATLIWPKLFLHTWNIDFLSGISTWNNIEFGMCFKRV